MAGLVLSLLWLGAFPRPAAAADQRLLTGGSVDLYVFADSAYLAQHGANAQARICQTVAQARTLFEQAGLGYGLVHVGTTLFDSGDPYAVTPLATGETSSGDLLSAFGAWQTTEVGLPDYDVALLLTGLDLDGSTTGLAYTFAACTFSSAMLQQSMFESASFDANGIVHGLGHNLGMCHDPPDFRGGLCPTLPPGPPYDDCGGKIMAAVVSPTALATEYSACSIYDHDAWLGSHPSACLTAASAIAATGCEAYVCPEAPLSGCYTAQKSTLTIKNPSNPDKTKLVWKWKKGDAVDVSAFGDPSAAEAYRLCLYDSKSGSDFEFSGIHPGTGAAWVSKGAKGWVYKDKTAAAEGVSKVVLKPGALGKSTVQLQAKGAGLSFVYHQPESLMAVDSTVRVQLIGSGGQCFDSTFGPDNVVKNTVELFKAH